SCSSLLPATLRKVTCDTVGTREAGVKNQRLNSRVRRRTVDERSRGPAERGSSRWRRSIAAVDQAGGLPRNETSAITPNASGTDQGAGCCTKIATQPRSGGPPRANRIEPDDATSPVS